MKTLKDPGQVLEIMSRKLDELHKRFPETDWKEAARISGQEDAIGSIAFHIRHAIEDHGYFGVEDMACVYEYVADAKENAHEYSNPRDTWLMKGGAEGAAWAMKEIEKRNGGGTMTDEEWNERIAKEKKARADAVELLCQSLQVAGVPLWSLEIVERGVSDCMVKATFEWGERWANISMDAPHTALWDILRQIPELR